MNLSKIKLSAIFLISTIVVSANSMAAEPCKPPAGSQSILNKENIYFILFGELHGTSESPAIFSEIVCLAVTLGKKVLVGLEFPESARTAFQAFLISKGSIEDENRFLTDSYWVQPKNVSDGRTSDAMLNMVKRLRLLREAGYDLSITTFQRQIMAGQESQTPYEKGLAASLIESKMSDSFDLVIVLVGNVHASKAVGRLPFEPMAMHLPKESTLSLNMKYSGGSTWACMPECGVHSIARPAEELIGQITLDDQLSAGYDGILNLGSITASPPVNDGQK